MAQQGNMPEKLTELPPSFEQQLAGNYLGSPAVVGSILQGFITQMVEWVHQRGLGTMTAADMVAKAHERARDFAAIFAGEDPAYLPIKGWNARIGGLQEYLKTDLGHYWQSQRASHEDDPYRVLYAYLLWAVVDAMTKHEDEDLAAAVMGGRIQQVIRLLTGSNRK
jgi:hypothetical protein